MREEKVYFGVEEVGSWRKRFFSEFFQESSLMIRSGPKKESPGREKKDRCMRKEKMNSGEKEPIEGLCCMQMMHELLSVTFNWTNISLRLWDLLSFLLLVISLCQDFCLREGKRERERKKEKERKKKKERENESNASHFPVFNDWIRWLIHVFRLQNQRTRYPVVTLRPLTRGSFLSLSLFLSWSLYHPLFRYFTKKKRREAPGLSRATVSRIFLISFLLFTIVL